MKEGWTYKKLGEVCVKITDGSHNPPKGVERSNNIMLSSQNVQNGYLNMSSVRYLSDDDFKIEDQRTKASKGDVLLTIVGTIGRTCVLNGNEGNITFQRSVAILKPSKDVTSYYLMYYLLSQSNTLNTKAQGAAQKGIYLKQLGDFEILYPTLSEQQRIVSRLDSAFADIDELKANAEKKLSEARALFQKALTKAMEPKEGWEEKTLGEICQIKGGKRLPKGYVLSTEPLYNRYITVADFTINGTVIPSTVKYISEEVYKTIHRYTITSADVYVTIVGSTVGKAGIIPPELDGANLTENACKLVLNKDCDKRFVYYIMCSDYVIKQEQLLTKVSAQPKLALNRLASIVVYIPSYSEQQRIVSRLDSLSAHVRELEEVLQKTIAECDALKQALLRQVFE